MKKEVVVKKEEMNVVDGKVVISSEELAKAIMDENLALDQEENCAAADVVIFKGVNCK